MEKMEIKKKNKISFFVIARSEATKQSHSYYCKIEIASPTVRNDFNKTIYLKQKQPEFYEVQVFVFAIL